jgi:hypothetical protein
MGGPYLEVQWASMNTTIVAESAEAALAAASAKFPKKRGMLAVQPIAEK